ncbi:unannotated protein [freshwater metagenome]|uniref:Unannotated protein n=1 Tax=freshwater metagenome TaxID=449393 RepID=A0A6J6B8Y3_9ZZZZ
MPESNPRSPVQAANNKRGSKALGKALSAPPPLASRTYVGTKDPTNPICGSASGTFIAPIDRRFESCGKKGTGPWNATLPLESLTVITGE